MWWSIPAAKAGISHFWCLNTCTHTALGLFKDILLPWDNVSEVLEGGQGVGTCLWAQVNRESFFFSFPFGEIMYNEEEAHFSSQEPSKVSPGRGKGGWSYRWSLSRTKQLVSYNQGQWRSHSQTSGPMEIEQVTWDLKELRSWFHLPEPQTPLRKVMEERLAGQSTVQGLPLVPKASNYPPVQAMWLSLFHTPRCHLGLDQGQGKKAEAI